MEPERGQLLVRIAKDRIAQVLGARPHVEIPHEPWLEEKAATFVTLHDRGELQGCIGSIEPRRPLREDVLENAVAAAFRDPRFEGVRREQLPTLDVEVSVLTPMERVYFTSEEDALRQIRPFVDGVVLRHGFHRGVLLPQVWDRRTDVREFVDAVKMKAGLPPGFWSNDLEVYRFQLEKFKEEKPS